MTPARTRVPPASTGHDRARLPDADGWVTDEAGVRIHWEAYGDGSPTIVMLPSAPIVHSRQWKGQVPYLARHFRVVTYDGRGNGRSDRPTEPEAYTDDRFAGDLLRVMDASGTEQAVLVGLCTDGVWRAVRFAAEHADRALGIVAFAVGVPFIAPPHPHRAASAAAFDTVVEAPEGWDKVNRQHWLRDYADFARFFFSEITSEPHSTKAIEDAVEWALDGSVAAMLADWDAVVDLDLRAVEAVCRSVRCPMLLVHGTEDTCQPPARAHRLAELTGSPIVMVEGADHMIPGRHPVLANLLIRDFVRSLGGPNP